MYKNYLKRTFDLLLSLIGFILISPVFIILWIWLTIANKGAGALFFQERPGKEEKIFKVIKFKTMSEERDADGKLLPDAERLTKVGRFVRSTSLDEIPQLFNVIKGDMSLVGPRPERKYFIDQIVKKAPHYTHLHKIRPGITSWGQVKYGYASNLDEMLERLPYDMMYLKNLSIYVDIKILIHTILVSLKANGK